MADLPEGFEPINEKSRTYFSVGSDGNVRTVLQVLGPIVGLRVKKHRFGDPSHALVTERGKQYYIRGTCWDFFTFEGEWTLSGDEFQELTKEETE